MLASLRARDARSATRAIVRPRRRALTSHQPAEVSRGGEASRKAECRSVEVGAYLKAKIQHLADTHEVIGDVRGEGLYLGVELVLDRSTKKLARNLTAEVCERLLDCGIIM